MPVLYLDVLVAVNLLIDFLLLSVTARLLRLPGKKGRLLAGASAGALSSCMILLPAMPAAVSILLKLTAAAAVVRLAFRWFGWCSYFKQMAVFFISSTLLAGIAYALIIFAAPEGLYVVDGVVYYNISPLTLVLLTVICYFFLWLGDRFWRKKSPVSLEYRLMLDCGKGMFTLPALYDTGNRLSDVFSGKPVAVVDCAALQEHLPEELRQTLSAPLASLSCPNEEVTDACTTAVRSRLRLLPFHSLGGEGLLPAFRPLHMYLIDTAGKSCDVTGAYIAVSPSLNRGDYQALIGGDLAGLF